VHNAGIFFSIEDSLGGYPFCICLPLMKNHVSGEQALLLRLTDSHFLEKGLTSVVDML
jgi:hypothetical protein